MDCTDPVAAPRPHGRICLRAEPYDLGATLTSGQAFRWRLEQGGWESVIGSRWVRLASFPGRIEAEALDPGADWSWLSEYLQIHIDLRAVLAEFPDDAPMREAVRACLGLRLLRQDPWECLASFILSSTKQIVQIQQIVQLLCERFGERVLTPGGAASWHAFPSAERLARLSEEELRSCKMGFRAPYLQATAKAVAERRIDLAALANAETEPARQQLVRLPGVGPKIANCVLLFAYGFQDAFPVDVWVARALRELYFPRRKIRMKRLEHFSRTHFGRYAGYAQQYLFHYVRTQARRRSLQSAPPALCPGFTP